MIDRVDDRFPSHPGEPFSYPISRLWEKLLTEEGVRQYTGPILKPSFSETDSTATFTLAVIDVAHTVDETTPVQFEQDGVVNPPTTAPAGVNGVYTYTFDKDPKHTISVAYIVNLKDLTQIRSIPQTFDFDTAANVLNLAFSINGTVATVKASFDTDTAIGTNKAEYSTDNGTSWTAFNVTSDLTGSFTVTLTSSAQTVLVRGKNAAGSAGPSVKIELPSLGSSLFVTMQITTTQAVITWAGFNVELSIDGGTWGTPPADDDPIAVANQITVTRTASNKVYAFRSTVNGQYSSNAVTIPALGTSTGGEFSSLANVLYSDTTNQIQFSWAWSGPGTTAFNVYVSEGGLPYTLQGTTSAGATSYLFTSTYDITVNHADPTVVIGFFLEAVNGSTIGVRSINTTNTYNHA